MGYITIGTDAACNELRVHYTDLGEGSVIVLMHGWPATHAMWEYQLAELPKHGFRVVAHTRRGFGLSDQPWSGYDYDTLADDLKAVLDALDLQDVTLVGFSMGGGEVARYLGRYGAARVARVAFVSAVTPYLLKSGDNPDGVDEENFDSILAGLQDDRFNFLTGFARQFFGVTLLHPAVSDATLNWLQSISQTASPHATERCVKSFSATDFRADLATIKIPTLVIHGSADKVVPLAASGARLPTYIEQAQLVVYEGAPHGLFVTEKERLNRDLVAFARGSAVEPDAMTLAEQAEQQAIY
jgi:pimeloyl-ACP methyl ester carboxylesterase